ncbi:MAG: hypothetical protein ACR2NL_01085 [Acidimicrobiia bacterium]
MTRIDIKGGADADLAAAIAAVVTQLLLEEAAARATPPATPDQSSWVQAGRMRQRPLVPKQGQDPLDWSQFTLGNGTGSR